VSQAPAVERLFSALESERAKPAIVFEGKSLTFGELDDLSRRYAQGLARAGVRRGDRIAVFAETRPEIVVALLGHYRLGALHVPMNDRYRGEEAAHVLKDSGAKALLLREGSPAEREASQLVWQGERPRRILLGAGGGAKPISPDLHFEDLIASSPIDTRGFVPADSDTAMLVYTSGTTGRSKGVALSFRALVANVLAQTELWQFSPRDCMALALPLFHVHGLCLGIHGALLHGMTTLLFERFEARRIIDVIGSDGATVFQGVPTMYVRLLEELSRAPERASDLSRARLFTSGSAALSTEDFAAFESATGHRILERYGMSETLFTLSNPFDDRRCGTVGRVNPGCEALIVEENREEAAAEELGELLVRSSGMMTGYWQRPEETASSLENGWFMTGDMARRDADGYVTLAGRKSVDFIKSGGFKISAREIEDVLRRHPAIRDVAVVGAPDRVWGERVVAAVVLDPEAGAPASEKELLDELSSFCAGFLADYKRPREVRVCEELPRNAMGKIQKHEIRKSLS
jgi:acyl-CoA synthetase (AMP-forming)/AMP-acid ligase II